MLQTVQWRHLGYDDGGTSGTSQLKLYSTQNGDPTEVYLLKEKDRFA